MPTFTQARETEVIESNISSDDQTEQISIQVIQILLTVKDTNFKSIKPSESWERVISPIVSNYSKCVHKCAVYTSTFACSDDIK